MWGIYEMFTQFYSLAHRRSWWSFLSHVTHRFCLHVWAVVCSSLKSTSQSIKTIENLSQVSCDLLSRREWRGGRQKKIFSIFLILRRKFPHSSLSPTQKWESFAFHHFRSSVLIGSQNESERVKIKTNQRWFFTFSFSFFFFVFISEKLLWTKKTSEKSEKF